MKKQLHKLQTRQKVQDKESAILDAIKGESDSLKTVTSMAEYEKEHPLLAILSPNVTQQFQPVGGSTIGYANIKDTAKINAYLRLPQVKSSFPQKRTFIVGNESCKRYGSFTRHQNYHA